ncbi:MAG: UbiD family decarboxylase domain-containing protein [Verrucomicrobiota bacterium]
MKTVLPTADFVIEGCVNPTEPLRDEGPFGEHTGYYNLPKPYPFFHVTANTNPQRDSRFPKGPSDVLDHATSEIAIGSKLGIDATKKIPGEGFKRPWPPLMKMDSAVKAKVEKMFNP